MAARSAEFVVASDSLPSGVPANYYQRVADVCRKLGAKLILDTSGGGLRHISSGVFLLKASVRELRECVGRELATEANQLAAAQELIDSGRAEVASTARKPRSTPISRQMPLRLVYVISRTEARIALAHTEWELERGEMALSQADCAVQSEKNRSRSKRRFSPEI